MLGSAVQAGLEQSGYTVDWLRNGGEAASALRDDEPDLVVLDLGLPEKDGLTVLRELRTRDSSLPVLILTARDTVEDRIAGLDVSSAKRDRRNTASGNMSDHYSGNSTAYAHDLVWGSSTPTQQSDEAASRIVSALGGPANWGEDGGVFNTTIDGIRYQIIYKSNVGGNHYDHIHMGARRTG